MQDRKAPLARREVLGAAAGTGSLAVAAALLPGAAAAVPKPVATPPAAADAASGYRLTDHVKTYYAKARI